MQTNNTKLKAGTEFNYHGETVWVEHDQENGNVSVCWNKARGLNDYYEVVKKDDLKPVNKGRSTIKQVVRPVSPEERAQRESRNEFFDRMALKVPFHCQNCGKPLHAYNKKAKRCVTAHILPKANFASIETDEANIFFIGADFIGCPCNCHDRWDMNVDIRITMNVYPIALDRFKNDLKFKLTPGELKQAYTYLNIQWQ